ncbi:hypothetical protein N9948_00135 [bacterium]|nr:hypothetical protein [bacterium]
MKAYIIRDVLDDECVLRELTDSLSKEDIGYFCFNDLLDLEKFINQDNPDEPVIFYPNIYVRYPITILKELNKDNGFDYIKTGNNIISFKPKAIKISRDGVYVPEGSNAIFFTLTNPKEIITYRKPTNLEVPRIFIYSHNRDSYLKMTLNSLLYSLEDCPEVPVTIILNSPTSEVEEVSRSFMDKYSQVDVLKVDQNIAYYAPNIGIQWYENKKCIIIEDDFLFPAAVRNLYPMWPYQFSYRLDNGVDYVSCRVSFLNIPYSMYEDWAPHSYSQRVGWKYADKNDSPRIMAQCYALNSSFYIDVSKNNETVVDRTYIENSRKIAIPNIIGYHIGWNQVQDGYYNYTNWADGFKYKEYKVGVTNLRDGETKTISTTDIKKLNL